MLFLCQTTQLTKYYLIMIMETPTKKEIERGNCGNFLVLKKYANISPMTSMDIPELIRVMDRCKNICGKVKAECMDATDLRLEKPERQAV
jgi:hypothetical protein